MPRNGIIRSSRIVGPARKPRPASDVSHCSSWGPARFVFNLNGNSARYRTLCYTKAMSESEPKSSRQLTVVPAANTPRISAAAAASIVVPAIIADAGDQAARRFLEFFAATIRNKNTRAGIVNLTRHGRV
jgi:hypothetical protein